MKFKRVMNESYVHPHSEDAISTYRRLANLKEDTKVQEIDEWALNEAAIQHGVQKSDLRHMVLGEDVSLDAASRALEAEKEIVRSKSDIEEALDEMLDSAEINHDTGNFNFETLLIEGEAGIGKTSIVSQWCKEHGFTFYKYDIRQASPESFEGVIANDPDELKFAMRKISRELLIPLSKPNNVFFIDEYNRGRSDIRQKLLDLILNHKLAVPMIADDFEATAKFYEKYGQLQEDGTLYFPNLLFVVCAQNPYGPRYGGTHELDAAEVARFKVRNPEVINEQVLQYLTAMFNNQIEKFTELGKMGRVKQVKNKIAMAELLLRSPDFFFDTTAERDIIYNKYGNTGKYLDPRSFEFLLNGSNGTVENVLKRWNDYCNRDKKPMAENILKDFKEVDDVANEVLDDGTDSDVFKRTASAKETLLNMIRTASASN